MLATTCDEVNSACSNSICVLVNGRMSYTCNSPFSCSGWYTEPVPTTATPTSSSDAADTCNSMYLSSCDEAESKFSKVGCSCFTCVAKNGVIEASCTSPFSCHPETYFPQNEASDTPELSSKEYRIVCAVYIVTAIVLAGSAKIIAHFYFVEKVEKKSSIKELVKQSMSTIVRYAYQWSLEAFMRDDGTPMGIVDFFCDKKELMGFLDCRKKIAAVRPRWMRFCAIVTTLMVTISLAFLLGTVVYNNENCVSTREVKLCCNCQTLCNGVDLGCDGYVCKSQSQCSSGSYTCSGASVSSDISTTSQTSINCDAASVETSDKANWVTMILSMVMSKAGSIAIGSAEDGSARQKLLHLATASTSIVLIVFGVVYSNILSKEDNPADPEANQRRLKSIGTTLVTGWWYDQVVGFGTILAQFGLYWICYYVLYRPFLEEVIHVGAAAVHPHKVSGLDESIMKTDGVKEVVGKPVTIEEVKLQSPTQQQH